MRNLEVEMYKDIKAIYDRERLAIFSMATTHLMDIGWRNAAKITDEEIAAVKGNGLMTKDFCQHLCRLAREIATTIEPVEFIQFCQVEKLYDTKGYKQRR